MLNTEEVTNNFLKGFLSFEFFLLFVPPASWVVISGLVGFEMAVTCSEPKDPTYNRHFVEKYCRGSNLHIPLDQNEIFYYHNFTMLPPSTDVIVASGINKHELEKQ